MIGNHGVRKRKGLKLLLLLTICEIRNIWYVKVRFLPYIYLQVDWQTLIHVFYNNHIYWTLAIEPACVVGDVCKILEEKLSLQNARVSLYEVGILLSYSPSRTAFDCVEMEDDGSQSKSQTNGDGVTPTTDTVDAPQIVETEGNNNSSKELRVNVNFDNNQTNNGKPEKKGLTTPLASQMFKGLIKPNLAITRLDDDILVMDILQKWGKSGKWRFFVKEDILDVGNGKSHKAKPNDHKAPILICASERNSGISLLIDIPDCHTLTRIICYIRSPCSVHNN